MGIDEVLAFRPYLCVYYQYFVEQPSYHVTSYVTPYATSYVAPYAWRPQPGTRGCKKEE